MARDESRRLRKVPAAKNASPPGNLAKRERAVKVGNPSSSPNRTKLRTATAKANNESVISGIEDRRSKLKRAQ